MNQEIDIDTQAIQIVDVNDDLELHHAVVCDDFSSDEIKAVRGHIKTLDGKLVCKSFAYTPEILSSNAELVDRFIKPFVEASAAAFTSFEGSLLRVWCFGDKWWISTHRRIDAFRSRWGSDISYGELFIQALTRNSLNFDEWTSTLDKNNIYTFLLRNGRKNRIVCDKYELPEIFLVGTFKRSDEGEFTYVDASVSNDTKLQSTPRVEYSSLEDIIAKVNSSDPKADQGVVFIDKNGASAKLVNPAYDKLARLRNNEPSIIAAYAKLRTTEQRAEFLELYSDLVEEFTRFETILDDICNNILRKYINRFIYRRVAILPPDQYGIMNNIHQMYLQSKRQNQSQKFKVDLELVRKVVFEQPAGNLVSMWRTYIRREQDFGNGNWVSEELKQKILSASSAASAAAKKA